MSPSRFLQPICPPYLAFCPVSHSAGEHRATHWSPMLKKCRPGLSGRGERTLVVSCLERNVLEFCAWFSAIDKWSERVLKEIYLSHSESYSKPKSALLWLKCAVFCDEHVDKIPVSCPVLLVPIPTTTVPPQRNTSVNTANPLQARHKITRQ